METHLGKSSLVVLSTGMFISDAALGLLNLMEGRGECFESFPYTIGGKQLLHLMSWGNGLSSERGV